MSKFASPLIYGHGFHAPCSLNKNDNQIKNMFLGSSIFYAQISSINIPKGNLLKCK